MALAINGDSNPNCYNERMNVNRHTLYLGTWGYLFIFGGNMLIY